MMIITSSSNQMSTKDIEQCPVVLDHVWLLWADPKFFVNPPPSTICLNIYTQAIKFNININSSFLYKRFYYYLTFASFFISFLFMTGTFVHPTKFHSVQFFSDLKRRSPSGLTSTSFWHVSCTLTVQLTMYSGVEQSLCFISSHW